MNDELKQKITDLSVCNHDKYFKEQLLSGDLDAAYHLGMSMFAEKRFTDASWLLKIAAADEHAQAAYYLRLVEKRLVA